MAKAKARGKSRSVKSRKKTKSVKVRKKAKVAKKVGKKVAKQVKAGFQSVWAQIGDRLLKEIQNERGWDRQKFTAKIEDSDTQIQILASTKRLFPGIPEPAFVPEIRAAEAAIGQMKLPAFNAELDFWQSSRDGDDPNGDPHS